MDAPRKINKLWHSKNRMPPKPTLKDRAVWHIRHAKNCDCREMPKTVADYIKAYKIKG
jgi:hypothetical protein